MKSLLEQLNYTFRDPAILEMALTHRSKGGAHNERLEFLGDAVVNFVIADILFQQFPEASEGELSRYRASLVNRDALYELGAIFKLGDYLHLGQGELKSGGQKRHSILSCAMEAIIGAVYVDGGFDAVENCLRDWYQPLLEKFSSHTSHKDPKTRLQEYVQSQHGALPEYKVETTEGEAHNQIFTVACTVQKFSKKTIGQGSSRRRAEQAAAEIMLTYLKKELKK